MLTQITEFSTWHTAQMQAGKAHLVALTNLVSLRIGQRLPPWGRTIPPSLDGSTLTTFARITSLESVALSEARLTGKDLEVLATLPRLKKLSIQTTDIPAADVDSFRAAHPAVTVDFKPISEAGREALLVKKLRLE